MAKEWETRWKEMISYLNTHFPNGGSTGKLGDHVESLVKPHERQAISDELSLGWRIDLRDSKSAQRAALRALMLCQRVYYSDLWAKRTFGQDVISYGVLAANWKADSQSFWSSKNEAQIRQGIAMFVPVEGATVQGVAAAARQGPPDGIGVLPGNVTLSRTDGARGAAETCYNGVVAWLLLSGLVSMRWVMQNSAPQGEGPCTLLFGKGETVWPLHVPFKPSQHDTPKVAEGFIVHMWNADNFNWNGHWVISNGNGTVCGVNNGEMSPPKATETVLKPYTRTATLEGQWLGYAGEKMKETTVERKQVMVPFNPPQWSKASMVKINPLKLPNLM